MRPRLVAAPLFSLYTGEIGHVQALHSVMGGLSGLGDIAAVALGHQGHLLQSADLHLHFFPQADTLVGHSAVQSVQILFPFASIRKSVPYRGTRR